MSASDNDPLFRRAFEEAGVAMGLVDLDGHWLHVNRALCYLVGYTGDELRTRTFQDITHPEEVGEHLRHIRELLEGRAESYHVEMRFVHRLGHHVQAFLTASLLRNDEGHPSMFILQIHGLDEHEAPKADGMFELPVALHFVAGFDRYFKKLSKSWSDLLGYPLEVLLGRSYMEFVHPDDREQTLAEAAHVEGGREAVLFENRYRHADGTYRWLLWTAIPVVAERLIYGVAIDYTARKELELQLKQAFERQRTLYDELLAATSRIQELRSGLVKICAWTKRVEHNGRWIPTEEFLTEHLQLNVTHGISEEGARQLLSDMPEEPVAASTVVAKKPRQSKSVRQRE